MVGKDLALKLIERKSWHHDFEIVPGVRTHGSYNPEGLWQELQLPEDLNGVSLLDVGACNGYFSFEARKRGARVVAFDIRHKDNSGFGLAQHINGFDDIEHHQVNILDLHAGDYGRFDIVLAMGLLYHTPDPFRALANCAALSRERLLVESFCIDTLLSPAMASEPIMRFIPDPARFPDQGQPNTDPTNFWGFTAMCLRRMVEDVGFAVQRADLRGDRVLIDARSVASARALARQTLGYGVRPRIAAGDADDPDGWAMF
ncbi:MAG: methyltransferase domain-containing protein [Acidobacteriota bacterium]